MTQTQQGDLYTVLQVASQATAGDIETAYKRLQELYSAERLQGGPPEFAELARQKRNELDAAYQVLGDPMQRAAYDQQHITNGQTALDYRPLPPARRQERAVPAPERVTEQAARVVRRAGVRGWVPALLVGLSGLAFLALLIFSNVRVDGNRQALATPTIANVQLPFPPAQIEQFRSAAQTSNTAQTWAALGNALFNNLQTVRENAPQAPQYQGMLPQWLEVVQAYDQSLAIEENETVRSDRAFALLAYGDGTNDDLRRQEAVAQTEQALQQGASDPRALINYGLILVGVQPPRVEEATTLWRRVLETAPDAPEAARARTLLQTYGQADAP